ncbi:MAG: hypothetical protein IJO46_08135, partial [Thermoguttaceae bacterium]|nr:hypothetical protein [Thermoguttaceae bacterium]
NGRTIVITRFKKPNAMLRVAFLVLLSLIKFRFSLPYTARRNPASRRDLPKRHSAAVAFVVIPCYSLIST